MIDLGYVALVWDLDFAEDGTLHSPDSARAMVSTVVSRPVQNLFIVSHGWNNSRADAEALYKDLFPLIRDAVSSHPGFGPIGFVGVHWPSLWFPPTPATPPAARGVLQAGSGARTALSAGTQSLTGAEIAASLRDGFSRPEQKETVTEIGRLIDAAQAVVGTGETEAAKLERIQRIHSLLSSLVPTQPAEPEPGDDGETALLLTSDPKRDYEATARQFGTAPPASAAQGIGDWLASAVNGAKDALRVLSYTVMKARAGDIGRAGLGPLLADLRRRAPALRVHLIGHSFGARLVSFALFGVDSAPRSPVASLVLIQGAFSHWSFSHAHDTPFGRAGVLDGCADRVSGPLVATFSKHDWAVGIWYPKASFLARQDQAGKAPAGRWGGVGADGFQAVTPKADLTMPGTGSTVYGFKPKTFHRVDAAAVINDVKGQPFSGAHSDIRKAAVADLIAQAAAP